VDRAPRAPRARAREGKWLALPPAPPVRSTRRLARARRGRSPVGGRSSSRLIRSRSPLRRALAVGEEERGPRRGAFVHSEIISPGQRRRGRLRRSRRGQSPTPRPARPRRPPGSRGRRSASSRSCPDRCARAARLPARSPRRPLPPLRQQDAIERVGARRTSRREVDHPRAESTAGLQPGNPRAVPIPHPDKVSGNSYVARTGHARIDCLRGRRGRVESRQPREVRPEAKPPQVAVSFRPGEGLSRIRHVEPAPLSRARIDLIDQGGVTAVDIGGPERAAAIDKWACGFAKRRHEKSPLEPERSSRDLSTAPCHCGYVRTGTRIGQDLRRLKSHRW
jgi:hypothetical protein